MAAAAAAAAAAAMYLWCAVEYEAANLDPIEAANGFIPPPKLVLLASRC